MADELTPTDFPQGELLFYTSKDGKVKMEIRVEDETIWMSQQMMAELFQTTKQNISLHIANIAQCGELQEVGTVKEYLTVRKEGNRQVKRKVVFYNLDWIISVGYRVNSIRGTQFRIWATQQLSELLRKGFVLDKERLKNQPIKGATATSIRPPIGLPYQIIVLSYWKLKINRHKLGKEHVSLPGGFYQLAEVTKIVEGKPIRYLFLCLTGLVNKRTMMEI